MRDCDLLDGVVEEVAQQVFQLFGEPIVEAGGEQVLAGRAVVRPAIRSDRAGFAADGEAHNHRPDEDTDIELALSHDDVALVREVVDHARRKQRSQQRRNCVWGELHHSPLRTQSSGSRRPAI